MAKVTPSFALGGEGDDSRATGSASKYWVDGIQSVATESQWTYLPDIQQLNDVFRRQKASLTTAWTLEARQDGAWAEWRLLQSLFGWIVPVHFREPVLETAYSAWELNTAAPLQRWCHLLLLLLILFLAGGQIFIGVQWLPILLYLAMIAVWVAAATLLWRRNRTPSLTPIVAALYTAMNVLMLVVTLTCNEVVYNVQCVTWEQGYFNGGHYMSAFANMLLFGYSLQIQARDILIHMSIFYGVWFYMVIGRAPVSQLTAVCVPIAMCAILILVAYQAYSRHISLRMQFQMVFELSQQVRQKQQAFSDAQGAHAQALAAQEQAVRETTTRVISDAIMGYTCHQLRNPLHALRGILELLQHRCTVGHTIDESDVENFRMLQDSTRALAKVADDVLDFQMLQSGTPEERPTMTSTRSIIEAAAAFDTLDQAQDIAVSVAENVPQQIFADAARLTQLLSIGLSNAVKHRKRGTEIHIQVQKQQQQLGSGYRTCLRFQVTNEGHGIRISNVDSLFDPYRGGRSGTGASIRGAGLGLPISRLVANMLKGEVGLEEDDDGKTTYWFAIPLLNDDQVSSTTPSMQGVSTMSSTYGPVSVSLSSTAESPMRSRPARSSSSATMTPNCPWIYWSDPVPITTAPPHNLLVVDDLQTNRKLLTSMLRRQGHNVSELEDGDQITAFIAQDHKVDVLLLDIHMVRSDGRDITRLLRAHGHRFPIIAVTGNVSATDVLSYQDAGLDGVLGKPFNGSHLSALLQAVITRVA